MKVETAIQELSANISAIHQLVAAVPPAQAVWRPTDADWSILEVVHHLYDEEREDFRARIQHLLAGRSDPWAPIDPAGWVNARSYNSQILSRVLTRLMLERQSSLAWLRELGPVDWSTAYAHGQLSGLTAGDLLASWVAHDLLHLRQLAELKYAFGAAQAEPYGVRYAGPWS